MNKLFNFFNRNTTPALDKMVTNSKLQSATQTQTNQQIFPTGITSTNNYPDISTAGSAAGLYGSYITGPTVGPATGSGFNINSPDTAGSYSTQTFFPTIHGLNELEMSAMRRPRLAVMVIPDFSVLTVEEMYNFHVHDVIMIMNTLECWRLKTVYTTTQIGEWEKVTINAFAQPEPVTQPVEVNEDRKEVFEEFEKHLTAIPESKKENITILQRAKGLFNLKPKPVSALSS